ncbi:ankyrin repeat and SOCS box protein 16 isoform 1-T1 [Ara ararauna]
MEPNPALKGCSIPALPHLLLCLCPPCLLRCSPPGPPLEEVPLPPMATAAPACWGYPALPPHQAQALAVCPCLPPGQLFIGLAQALGSALLWGTALFITPPGAGGSSVPPSLSHGPGHLRLQLLGAAVAAAAAGAAGAGGAAPSAGSGAGHAPCPARAPAAPVLPGPRCAQRSVQRGPAAHQEHLQGREQRQHGHGDGQRGAGVGTGAGCAELLLAHGARVGLQTRERRLTPLHVAARQGLAAHVELYLCHGADPAWRSRQGETPLNAACAAAERRDAAERYGPVCERLLGAGADPSAAGLKHHAPLHNACANGQAWLVRLLLRHGADPTATNCAGDTPMDCALRAVEEYQDRRPEDTIALLLDHGAGPIHPKMLRFCCRHPPALEVVLNTYDRVPPAEGWVGAVPPELWEEHREFYSSAVRMAGEPRRLQHLARCALRCSLGPRCHDAVPALPLPPALRRYLRLPLQGLIS